MTQKNQTLNVVGCHSIISFFALAGGFWIAGVLENGRWYWEGKQTKTQITDTDWTPGQPDGKYGNKKCLSLYYQAISPKLQWGDGKCDVLVNYICEKRAFAGLINSGILVG